MLCSIFWEKSIHAHLYVAMCPTRHCINRAVGYQTDNIWCKLCLTGAGDKSWTSSTQMASRSTDSLLLLQFTAAFPFFWSQLTLLPGCWLPNHSDWSCSFREAVDGCCVQSQLGWSSEKLCQVKGVPAHGKVVGIKGSLRVFPTQAILWF